MSGSASRVAGGLEADLRVTWHERTPPLRYQHCDSYEPLLILARTGTSAQMVLVMTLITGVVIGMLLNVVGIDGTYLM